MKNFKYILTLVVTLTAVACSQKNIENEYLGKMPSFAQKFYERNVHYEAVKKAFLEKYKDVDIEKRMIDGAKADEEIQEFYRSSEQEVEDYLKENPLVGTQIPFEQNIDKNLYLVKNIEISYASKGWYQNNQFGMVHFSLDCDIKDRTLKQLFIKLEDNKGQVIQLGIFHINIYNREEFYGYNLAQMQDFAKVVFITKEEYNSLSN